MFQYIFENYFHVFLFINPVEKIIIYFQFLFVVKIKIFQKCNLERN